MTPQKLLKIHFCLTVIWAILIIPSVLWWSHSVPWLVFMSAYAIVISHWSAWQAARGEVYMDESPKV